MSNSIKRFLFWAPRLITVLLAFFLAIFAADVFTSGYGIWKTLFALFIHLIPSFVILLILIISWNREWIGGIIYITLAVYYIFTNWNKFEISVFLIIPLPLILIGILFFIGWFRKKEINTR